jgi:hypothetical protein
MPVRHGQTPARRLYLPESEPLWRAGRGFVVRDLPWMVEKLRVIWHSGVSAERRHLKIGRKVCGGLPTRRYGEGESFAVPLKIARLDLPDAHSPNRRMNQVFTNWVSSA